MKALALVRTQKVEESLVLCDEVLAAKPSDESVLNAMSHVLRGLGRRKWYSDLPCRPFHATLLPSSDLDIISMYETAWKQQPSNEELGVNVFNVNVRVANWKAAQQVRAIRDNSRPYDFYMRLTWASSRLPRSFTSNSRKNVTSSGPSSVQSFR